MLAEEVIDEEFEDEEEEDALAGGLAGPAVTAGPVASAGKKQPPGGTAPKVPEKLSSKGSDRKKSIAGEISQDFGIAPVQARRSDYHTEQAVTMGNSGMRLKGSRRLNRLVTVAFNFGESSKIIIADLLPTFGSAWDLQIDVTEGALG